MQVIKHTCCKFSRSRSCMPRTMVDCLSAFKFVINCCSISRISFEISWNWRVMLPTLLLYFCWFESCKNSTKQLIHYLLNDFCNKKITYDSNSLYVFTRSVCSDWIPFNSCAIFFSVAAALFVGADMACVFLRIKKLFEQKLHQEAQLLTELFCKK